MTENRKKQLIYGMVPLAGLAFLLWYIRSATCDVIYSDYIRLVNSYLPDVWNPEKFLVPDVLTRLPINYLARIINVELFGFSITFERVLGAVSLALAGWVLGRYCLELSVAPVWYLLMMAVMFSLNKWEMITNGSGWSHFFAFACFYYHQLLFDRFWRGEEKRGDRLKLCALPWLITLGTAGPYCAVYSAAMMAAALFGAFRNRKREPERGKFFQKIFWMVLIPLLLYMVSNSFAVEEHAGATGRSLFVILKENPLFPFRFLLKSLAGMAVGGEELIGWMEQGRLPESGCYLLGALMAGAYLFALWMNLRERLYEKTLMPLILLCSGGMNHVLIFLSRYIFEKENYALSSRYALQFQVGILGILLTFAFIGAGKRNSRTAGKAAAVFFCLAILMGNGYTTYREICKAPYREANFEKMAETAFSIPSMDQETLKEREQEISSLYEYRKGADKIQNAFRILEENQLNQFR